MFGNVLSNVFARPATRRYPAEKRAPYADARGHIDFDIADCLFCGSCQRRCPSAAITVSRPERTLTFEPFRCIICEACVEACPKKSIRTNSEYRPPAYVKTTEVYSGSQAPGAAESTQPV